MTLHREPLHPLVVNGFDNRIVPLNDLERKYMEESLKNVMGYLRVQNFLRIFFSAKCITLDEDGV